VTVTPLDAAHGALIDELGIDHVCLRLSGALDALLEFTELRRTAVRLQESLLPAPPPAHPDFEAESRYLPSAVSALIGGDWYDVIDTETGPVFVIGDVMGHDMAAAARMGRLRTVVSFLVDRVPSMPQVLQQADAFCVRESILATCLLVRLGPDRLEIVTAGHPPPVIGRAGRAELPRLDTGPPLGVGAGCRPAADRVAFGPGDVAVLYTDGLVEARGEDIEVGLAALRAHLDGPAPPALAELVDDLLATRRDASRSDDLAVLAVRRRRPA
jgi:serine phosphatase RsbU (regulator of sigma subunit)